METVRARIQPPALGNSLQLLLQAQNNGDLRGAKRIMAILAVVDGTLYSTIAATLKIS